jgi:hypothetical protein
VRTSPLYAPQIKVGIEGRASPAVGRVAMLAPPGRYTVRLAAGGQEQTQSLEVRKDPNSGGSEEEIRQQRELFQDLFVELNGVVDMINALEVARGQLASLKPVVGDSAVKAQADSLDQKLIAVEEELVQLRVTGRGQDLIRYPAKLGEKLIYLIGDVGGSDHAPTQSQRDVAALLKERARSARTAFDRVTGTDVAAFNGLLREKGLAGVLTTPPEPPR